MKEMNIVADKYRDYIKARKEEYDATIVKAKESWATRIPLSHGVIAADLRDTSVLIFKNKVVYIDIYDEIRSFMTGNPIIIKSLDDVMVFDINHNMRHYQAIKGMSSKFTSNRNT